MACFDFLNLHHYTDFIFVRCDCDDLLQHTKVFKCVHTMLSKNHVHMVDDREIKFTGYRMGDESFYTDYYNERVNIYSI